MLPSQVTRFLRVAHMAVAQLQAVLIRLGAGEGNRMLPLDIAKSRLFRLTEGYVVSPCVTVCYSGFKVNSAGASTLLPRAK